MTLNSMVIQVSRLIFSSKKKKKRKEKVFKTNLQAKNEKKKSCKTNLENLEDNKQKTSKIKCMAVDSVAFVSSLLLGYWFKLSTLVKKKKEKKNVV